MAAHSGPRRTWIILYIFLAAVVVTLIVNSFQNSSHGSIHTKYTASSRGPLAQTTNLDEAVLTGHAIAPKLGNETAKAELGRAAWKLFHTTFARFPDKPTKEESEALRSYVHLFQRLYPCGECASHFGLILDKFPPQVSSRSAAAAWGCHVHNEVNKSLKKERFDCSQIGDFYDCGCAGSDNDETGDMYKKGEGTPLKNKSKEQQHHLGGENDAPLELKMEE